MAEVLLHQHLANREYLPHSLIRAGGGGQAQHRVYADLWEEGVRSLGCSGGAGGVQEGRGTLCHKFSLSSIEVEDDLPGQLLSTDWHHNELHLNVYQESLLVTHKDWVVW